MARTHPAPPFAGRKHRTLPLIFYIRTTSSPDRKQRDLRSLFSSLGPTSLFVGSRLSKTSENTFYKHTKIAFIRRISNFGPNKITRFRKFFHRTHHFQPFSAVLTTSKKSPGKVSGNFKAVRTNFIHHALFTTASTIGKNTLPEIDPLVPGVILRIESAGRRLVNGDGTDVDPNPVAVDFVDHCRRQ